MPSPKFQNHDEMLPEEWSVKLMFVCVVGFDGEKVKSEATPELTATTCDANDCPFAV